MPANSFNVPNYDYEVGGYYSPRPSINHNVVAPYHTMKHDNHIEVNSGWVSLPVAFNNMDGPDADHTIRIKLYHPQYFKVVDYAAGRIGRPPMMPTLENTDVATLDPIDQNPDILTGQHQPVMHDMTYAYSAPQSTGNGDVAQFNSAIKVRYSIGKEKIYLQSSDYTAATPYYNQSTPLQYRPKLPTDGNFKEIAANILPSYTFVASVGPGFLEGAVGPVGFTNTVNSLVSSFAEEPTGSDAKNVSSRYYTDPYQGVA